MTETSTYDDEAANLPEEPAPMPVELQGHIGKHLRTVYGALVREPVPDKFMVLLQALADKERQEKNS